MFREAGEASFLPSTGGVFRNVQYDMSPLGQSARRVIPGTCFRQFFTNPKLPTGFSSALSNGKKDIANWSNNIGFG